MKQFAKFFLSRDAVLEVALGGIRLQLIFLARALESARRRVSLFASQIHEVEFRYGYRNLSRVLHGPNFNFLNYGIKLSGDEAPQLEAADEPDRLSIQLYHQASAGIDLSGRDVLEVSCGHGGGARYIAHYMRPKRMIGVDLNSEGVALCRGRYNEPGLDFRTGDAIDLPFEEDSFDALISVEATHRYPSFEAFVRESHRVLRPGGYLMIVDLRWVTGGLDAMRHELEQSSMELLEFEDLTPKVIASLDESAPIRTASLAAVVPKPVLQAMLNEWGVPGSPTYRGLVNGTASYSRFLLRKPAA